MYMKLDWIRKRNFHLHVHLCLTEPAPSKQAQNYISKIQIEWLITIGDENIT